MSATSKHSGGPGRDIEQLLLWGAIGTVSTVIAAVNIALRAAVALGSAPRRPLSHNPFALTIDVLSGRVRWTATATVILVGLAAVAMLVFVLARRLITARRGARYQVDRAARWTGRAEQIAPITTVRALETARRLDADRFGPGLPIAETVNGRRQLWASWQDVQIDIWGPRTGKTTSRVIPSILAAPGAVLTTSNKRDVVDATRALRASKGPVWVFDPQSLVDEPVDWWWNPLTLITSHDNDLGRETRAAMLADVFVSAQRDPNARTDAYFDSAGQELLTNLLLAAAVADLDLSQVYLWLTRPSDEEPAMLLRRSGYPIQASALLAVNNAPDRQRAGVFGTALQIASFMTNGQAMRWVTPPPPGTRRPHFDPAAFVAADHPQTLYSLSREGRGSAGALVAALTLAVTEAAETHAAKSGGRLPVPMVAALDEVANVCRLRELPNLYSHYGSRGICVLAILQSWSQGVEVWGREGMAKLWSAANVRVYGGGVSEVSFLEDLSRLIGDFDLDTHSVSHGRGGRSTSLATRRERILDVADLSRLPQGRAIVLASGSSAVLARTQPWYQGPHADEINRALQHVNNQLHTPTTKDPV